MAKGASSRPLRICRRLDPVGESQLMSPSWAAIIALAALGPNVAGILSLDTAGLLWGVLGSKGSQTYGWAATMRKGPGKSHRGGHQRSPDGGVVRHESAPHRMFRGSALAERVPVQPAVGSEEAYRAASGKPMPYRCTGCKRYFSLTTGTTILGLEAAAFAVGVGYLPPK